MTKKQKQILLIIAAAAGGWYAYNHFVAKKAPATADDLE